MDKPVILIIDDGRDIVDYCQLFLKDEFDFFYETSGKDALERLKTSSFNLILLDKNFIGTPKEKLFFPQDPTNEGLYILPELVKRYPAIPVVMVTSYGDLDSAQKALQLKAADYIEWSVLGHDKLFLKHRIEITLAAANDGSSDIIDEYNTLGIIGSSSVMAELFSRMRRAADSDATVLITGETGVGKELVARAVHRKSRRSGQPFVKIGCANIPSGLLESELFGYEKGAFTGAHTRRIGRFEYAHNGVLFLDEIAEMDIPLQAKFLRFVEEKCFERLGSNETLQADVRIVAASNRDLAKAIKENQFREDLYWRLNVLSITVPPLRERSEDIPLLIDHFIAKYSSEYNVDIVDITPEALTFLKDSKFESGNVRELEHTIASSIHFADRIITLTAILKAKESAPPVPHRACDYLTEKECALLKETALDRIENIIIGKRLEQKNGNVREAAQSLGISKTKLYKKLQELKLTDKIHPERKGKKK